MNPVIWLISYCCWSMGVRNERGAFGHYAPSRLLHQAADDLMVAHGATRKPLFRGIRRRLKKNRI